MANHIASISSSSRATRLHDAMEASQHSETGELAATSHGDASNALHESTTSELAKMSVVSLSDDDCAIDISLTSTRLTSRPPETARRKVGRRTSGGSATSVKPDYLSSKLKKLESVEDIDSNLRNEDLNHSKVLERIEQRWVEISKNLDATTRHLQSCSQQVTESSSSCLEALLESVGTTCDNIDDELKAFYHLMTKCDELTTKLSIATSFREEIKTLRKSIETLEQLYKNKPQATVNTSTSSVAAAAAAVGSARLPGGS